MGFHGIVTSKDGFTAFADGEGPPTALDMDAINTFGRFLAVCDRPADPMEPGSKTRIPGAWWPWATGIGPAPPEGYDTSSFTALPFPG